MDEVVRVIWREGKAHLSSLLFFCFVPQMATPHAAHSGLGCRDAARKGERLAEKAFGTATADLLGIEEA